MNIYLISQTENGGYDTFDAAIVCAESEADARLITPGSGFESDMWCKSPEAVTVELIGTAAPNQERGIVLDSFNAG